MAGPTKLALQQTNTALATENEALRTENSKLRAQLAAERDAGNRPVYMSARPGFQPALRRLALEYPERGSFTLKEIMAKAAELKKGKNNAGSTT
jgi:regulator of replication initiation timing